MQWNHTWGIGIHISYHSTISPLLYWQIFIFIFTGKTATSVTSPNRLLKDGSMPTAGVKSTVSRTKHNYLHSILSSQILWMPPSASLTQLPQPPPPSPLCLHLPRKRPPPPTIKAVAPLRLASSKPSTTNTGTAKWHHRSAQFMLPIMIICMRTQRWISGMHIIHHLQCRC